jgi:hypothetical protein
MLESHKYAQVLPMEAGWPFRVIGNGPAGRVVG